MSKRSPCAPYVLLLCLGVCMHAMTLLVESCQLLSCLATTIAHLARSPCVVAAVAFQAVSCSHTPGDNSIAAARPAPTMALVVEEEPLLSAAALHSARLRVRVWLVKGTGWRAPPGRRADTLTVERCASILWV